MNQEVLEMFKKFQKDEMTGAAIYRNLAKTAKDSHNRDVLNKMAGEELKHANEFAAYTKVKIRCNRFKLFFYTAMGKVLGLTFALKYFEGRESTDQNKYSAYIDHAPEIKSIIEDEEGHEENLIAMIKEEKLNYVGSMILGLNDALVELTGALAGYTLAMQNTKYIAMAGLITGISAAFSMAASGYLATQADGDKDAKKASLYTGLTYLATVAVLILPYLMMPAHGYVYALGITMLIAILIIAGFNKYVSVVQDVPFKKRFVQMTLICVSIAALSFVLGLVLKSVFNIDM